MFPRSIMAPKQLTRRQGKFIDQLMNEVVKATRRAGSQKRRLNATVAQLVILSNEKSQTQQRIKQLAQSLKSNNQAIKNAKRLKNGCKKSLLWYIRRVKGTKQKLKLYFKGVPTGGSSATATAMNAKRTRTVQTNTLLTYGFKK